MLPVFGYIGRIEASAPVPTPSAVTTEASAPFFLFPVFPLAGCSTLLSVDSTNGATSENTPAVGTAVTTAEDDSSEPSEELLDGVMRFLPQWLQEYAVHGLRTPDWRSCA